MLTDTCINVPFPFVKPSNRIYFLFLLLSNSNFRRPGMAHAVYFEKNTEPEVVILSLDPEVVILSHDPEVVILFHDLEVVILSHDPKVVIFFLDPEIVILSLDPKVVILFLDAKISCQTSCLCRLKSRWRMQL